MKKIKWLEYFKGWLNVESSSFLEQLDTQLRPQFEYYLGKQFDWKKLILYIEPVVEVLFFEEIEGIKVARLICSLNHGWDAVNCEIVWHTQDGRIFILPDTKELNEVLIFRIIKFDESHVVASGFPTIGNEDVLYKLNTDINFPVYLLRGVISHEGNLLITLKDHSKVGEVQRIFTQMQASWNDEGFIMDAFPTYRGKLHQIYFTEWTEEGRAEFYYDTGSAIDGVHEYLISSLKAIEDDILKVELEAI